ncbi:MAG: pentapeptide repeat-containing protein [Candidatus Nitrosopolaris sp.]
MSIETLLRIDKIERYLRVLDPIGTTSKTEKFLDIDNEKQLDLLRNREFNKYVEQGIPIHLTFEKLAGCDLQNFHFFGSMLFKANLSGANLSRAKSLNTSNNKL